MRIAVIAPPWLPVPPPAYGGTELVLDTLCRGLAAAGHDVLLHASGDSTCPVERRSTYELHQGFVEREPATELEHVIAGYEEAEAWGADVVHDHTLAGPAWARLGARRPVATTNHGPFDVQEADVFVEVAPEVAVVAISHHQARTAVGVPIAAVIHHGIDLSAVAPGDGSGGYALFLGRMTPDKGVETAVRVARKAGMPLRIAAKMREPAEIAYFRERVEPLLGGDVEYVGEVGGDDKQRLLREARCLLNPIDWAEPFGMVMIEALACGTPVVATPCGAAPEIVEHGRSGFLAPDVDGLVAGLERAGQLDRAACRARAETAFSMERMAADHVALYRSMLEGATVGSDRHTAPDVDDELVLGGGDMDDPLGDDTSGLVGAG